MILSDFAFELQQSLSVFVSLHVILLLALGCVDPSLHFFLVGGPFQATLWAASDALPGRSDRRSPGGGPHTQYTHTPKKGHLTGQYNAVYRTLFNTNVG